MDGIASAAETSWWGGLRLRVLALAAVAVTYILTSFAFAPQAHAGDYPVYECYPNINASFPDMNTAGIDNNVIGFGESCDGSQPWHGGVIYARLTTGSDINGSAWVDPPAGTYFHRVAFYSFMGPTDCGFSGGTRFWGGQTVWSGGGALWHRDFNPPCGYSAVSVNQNNATEVSWNVQCAASVVGFCAHEERSDCGGYCYIDWNAIGDFYAEVYDYTKPVLSIGGSAFDNQTTAGSVGLNLSATDQGSGVRSAWVDVNGQRYANVPTNCPSVAAGGAYGLQLRPCTNLSTSSVTLNTASAPFHEGANSLEVCAADWATLAGTTANTDCIDRTLNVDNSCTDSQGVVQGTASSLSAGFDDGNGGKSRSLTTYSTQGAKLVGDLDNTSGAPIAGASICLFEQIDAPAEIRQLTQVTKTRSDGSYSLQLPAGPSRTYDVFYRQNDNTLSQKGLDLASIVVPSFEVGPYSGAAAQASAKRGHGRIRNGQAASFTGRIPGPYAGDRVVTLQALVGRGCTKPKKKRRHAASTAKKRKRCQPDKWRTFKTLRTDAGGSYSGLYRFTQTHGTVRYSFRAVVPDQAGYPYKAGISDVRQVTVRGGRG